MLVNICCSCYFHHPTTSDNNQQHQPTTTDNNQQQSATINNINQQQQQQQRRQPTATNNNQQLFLAWPRCCPRQPLPATTLLSQVGLFSLLVCAMSIVMTVSPLLVGLSWLCVAHGITIGLFSVIFYLFVVCC